MDRKNYLWESDKISIDIVKFAISLPETSLLEKAKTELIKSTTKSVSNYKIACYEDSIEKVSEKLDLAIVNAGVSKFWLDFLENEHPNTSKETKLLSNRLNDIIIQFIQIREVERKKYSKPSSYVGEWLLED